MFLTILSRLLKTSNINSRAAKRYMLSLDYLEDRLVPVVGSVFQWCTSVASANSNWNNPSNWDVQVVEALGQLGWQPCITVRNGEKFPGESSSADIVQFPGGFPKAGVPAAPIMN
jgi:hypothetical protein